MCSFLSRKTRIIHGSGLWLAMIAPDSWVKKVKKLGGWTSGELVVSCLLIAETFGMDSPGLASCDQGRRNKKKEEEPQEGTE